MSSDFVDGFNGRSRHGLNGERAGDAHSLFIYFRLVVEGFLRRVAGNRHVDLRPRHALFDVRVMGDGLERDVWYGLVIEASADTFLRTRQFVIVVKRGHQTLFGEGEGDAGGIAGDPASAPLLGDVSGGAAAACRVEDEVARVGGH